MNPFNLVEYDRSCAYDRKQKSRGRPPGQSSKKAAPKTPVPDSTGFAQHERTRSLPRMSSIDPGHLDAMQYDFGEVAGNLAASSLPQNADLTAFSKSEK